jgi:hypothetical protein
LDTLTIPATKVLYVLGSQRGGTTILGRLMGTIEGLEFGGEMRRLWLRGLHGPRSCGCGKRQQDCEVWSRVLADLEGVDSREILRLQGMVVPHRHSWWNTRRLLRDSKVISAAVAEYGRVLTTIYRSFSEATGADVVIDSSKHPTDAAILARLPGITAYYVHIIRDPRGVVYSRQKRNRRGATNRSHPWQAIQTSLSWTARHLASKQVLRGAGGEGSLVVRYEDFVAEPAVVLERVAELVGVPPRWPPMGANRAVRLPTAHAPAGNGELLETEVMLSEDDRWKNDLPPIARVLTTTLTLPLLVRHGYAFPGRSRNPERR